MKKYKLIKEYPGSPAVGTLVEKEPSSKSYFFKSGNKNLCVINNHVENNPEYWEEIDDNVYYMVLLKESSYNNTWKPIFVPSGIKIDGENIKFFKTIEEANEFILLNKPCLSFNDIKDELDKHQTEIIKTFIKSRL